MEIQKRSWRQRLMALGIILIILTAGVGVAKYLIKTKPKARQTVPAKMRTLVTTQKISPVSTHAKIKALGIMIPAQEINLQARVSGKVEYLHPDFVPGGIIKKGDIVVRLDDTDYKLILQHKQNLLDHAEADLRIEEGSQILAGQEWEMISAGDMNLDKSSKDLALRKPHLAKVQADINMADTDLEKARIDLGRTVIKAPFNAIVREKNTDLGSQVTSQSSIAVLTGIDTFWAEISLPIDILDWIVLPQDNNSGSTVMVFSNCDIPYKGSIVRLMPDVDADGLMARILIDVKDPMGIKTNRTPLLLGSFIRAEIKGKKLENVFQIPRASLLDDDKVLTVAPDDSLHIQPVSVVWKNTNYVFIDKGLQPGVTIIVSNVPAPIEGMELDINNGYRPEGMEGDEQK